MSAEPWTPFGVDDPDEAPASDAVKIFNVTWRRPKSAQKNESTADPSAAWLRSALIGLGMLAATAAAVSFAAQYVLVYATKGIPWVAALEAAIPDAGAVVFACLGIALALKGKRALRARGGNLACVGLSLVMNLLAAHAGWRGIAIWVMPSAVYAFASDTLIGVIRAYVLAKLGKTDDGQTMLAIFGGLLLWCLRLTLAPASTLTGFRGWVLDSCPTAPGRTAVAAPNVAALAAAPETPASAAISVIEPDAESQAKDTGRTSAGHPPGESKRAQLIDAYEALRDKDARFGVRSKASEVARELAPGVGLAWGSARGYLYRYLDAEASS